MFVRFLLILVCVADCAFSEPYKCKNEYKPSDYIGEHRVPTDCKVKNQDCPHSWKSGVPQGSETAPPLVYNKFLTCHEGFTLCGYVPINTKTGYVLGNSGVTVGAGVDLGSKSSKSFSSLTSTLVQKLDPYFGLKQNLAACAAIERTLSLNSTEANQVTSAILDDEVNKCSNRYNNDKDAKAQTFDTLPRGVRTAIISVWHQFGYPKAYPNFWSYVTKNDWKRAVKELRNFYGKPDEQASGDIRRRNNEADIIEAALVKCNTSVDIVFLVDASGSVSNSDFDQGLDFIKNMVKAFPNERLSGNDSTRFGLSTFSSGYSSHFFLSDYTNQSDYTAAISRVVKISGGTRLGAALNNLLVDQFTVERGLRPDVDGLPRVLIVLTDGKSGDSVLIPAKNVQAKDIVVYAIGIGNYDLKQLEEVASSESHVYELSTFLELDKFIATITSSTCYEPRPVSLNQEVKTEVSKDTYRYFSYEVTLTRNLELNVIDLSGITFVYASRTNPHPYKYDHDIAFDLSTQKEKVIVISPILESIGERKKRSTENETRTIYVSVTSDTDSASFTIEGKECDPLNCTEGTNKILPTTPLTTLPLTSTIMTTSKSSVVSLSKWVGVSFAIMILIFETYGF